MGPFSFLDLFLRNKLPVENLDASSDVKVKHPFDELNSNQQEVVREYFRAALAVHNMLESLRRGLSVLHTASTLERFERAEKHYCGIGFLPVLPVGLHVNRSRNLSDFQAERMLAMGLLVRRVHGDLPHFYAGPVKKHAERLQKRKPEALVASATVGILKPRRK